MRTYTIVILLLLWSIFADAQTKPKGSHLSDVRNYKAKGINLSVGDSVVLKSGIGKIVSMSRYYDNGTERVYALISTGEEKNYYNVIKSVKDETIVLYDHQKIKDEYEALMSGTQNLPDGEPKNSTFKPDEKIDGPLTNDQILLALKTSQYNIKTLRSLNAEAGRLITQSGRLFTTGTALSIAGGATAIVGALIADGPAPIIAGGVVSVIGFMLTGFVAPAKLKEAGFVLTSTGIGVNIK